MGDNLITELLPVLGRSPELGFNVFDVMHHGVHEKQISNVFRWLLDPDGTHNFGDRFARIFVEELNRANATGADFPLKGYWVRQEVNTSGSGDSRDIADLVLESEVASIVIENYLVSDGHGHNFAKYSSYGARDGKRSAVVLLCRDQDRSLQTQGWEDAVVLTYGRLIGQLQQSVTDDPTYRRKNPDAYAFISQLHRKFVAGRGLMDDQEVLRFVTMMCDTGEARRYQEKQPLAAAEQFAVDLSEQARLRFGESRELLQRIKQMLKSFSSSVLQQQLNASLGEGYVREVRARYAGIYQWSINFDVSERDEETNVDEARLQLKFGPSAWFAIEQDPFWMLDSEDGVPDYAHLFLTRLKQRRIRQSAVTLQEVLDGLEPSDRRLHNEILDLIADER